MYQISLSVTATAAGVSYSRPWVCDTFVSPFNIGFYVTLVGAGSANYTVQHTYTDPFAVDLTNSANGTWINHEFLTSATTSDDGNYAFPIRALRVVISSAASASATISGIQAGPEI